MLHLILSSFLVCISRNQFRNSNHVKGFFSWRNLLIVNYFSCNCFQKFLFWFLFSWWTIVLWGEFDFSLLNIMEPVSRKYKCAYLDPWLSGTASQLTNLIKMRRELDVTCNCYILYQVMQGLAKSIAWDGEGATCLIEVCLFCKRLVWNCSYNHFDFKTVLSKNEHPVHEHEQITTEYRPGDFRNNAIYHLTIIVPDWLLLRQL